MARPIHRVVNDLPERGLRTALLDCLDWAAPGEYNNITSFEEMIESVTCSKDQELIQRVGERAIHLVNDPS